ncbi:jg12833 [Pararge aegeria aegeria]|uniref:Jg12833 protein n=1 Tax=Pararge aegeria aegeria TaxID=348720 RepID=A0A8S4RMW4_9NEOP|nr:jg12833 [Pararge aegeria aegeria]
MSDCVVDLVTEEFTIRVNEDSSEDSLAKNCEEPDQKHNNSNDVFPNAEQIWGMVGTILATLVCWIFYTKLRMRRKKLEQLQYAKQLVCIPRTGTKRREPY